MSFVFTTPVDVELGDSTGNAKIIWHLELESREWGLKSMITYAPPQIIDVTWFERDANDNEIEREEELTLDDITTESDDYAGGFCRPRMLYYEKGKWVLVF